MTLLTSFHIRHVFFYSDAQSTSNETTFWIHIFYLIHLIKQSYNQTTPACPVPGACRHLAGHRLLPPAAICVRLLILSCLSFRAQRKERKADWTSSSILPSQQANCVEIPAIPGGFLLSALRYAKIHEAPDLSDLPDLEGQMDQRSDRAGRSEKMDYACN